MKYIVLATLIASSLLIFGQDSKKEFSDEFKKKVSIDVCNCLNEKKEIKENDIISCFHESTDIYQSEIVKLIDEDSEVSLYEQASILGENLYFDLQEYLVKDCDLYYNFFNVLREQSYISMKKNHPQSKIDSLSNELSEDKTPELLWLRGNAYFATNEFKKAREDYELCLKIEPNYIQCLFFLGWLNEKEENYRKAIELYNQVFNMTKKREIIVFIEMAKRKSKS